MAKLAKNVIYVGDPVMESVTAIAIAIEAETGRRITKGEVIERAIEALRRERQET